jgi:hypothetical protein
MRSQRQTEDQAAETGMALCLAEWYELLSDLDASDEEEG